jgi:hypothetical protein
MAVDDQMYGRFETDVTRGSGSFACKALFVRGKIDVNFPEDDREAAKAKSGAIKAALAANLTYKENFNVGRGANGN